MLKSGGERYRTEENRKEENMERIINVKEDEENNARGRTKTERMI